MTTITDLRPLHLRALVDAHRIVAAVRPADLTLPTPCTDWDLRALLAHMIGQNHGFAAAIADGDAPVESFAPLPPDPDDIIGDWTRSADRLTAAFTAAAPDQQVRLVEISAEQPFPLTMVAMFQLVDTVIHNWDVATTIGMAYRPDDDQLAASLGIARQIPDGADRERPGAAFAHAVPATDDPTTTDDWTTTLALLGRQAR
ncbi:TIGR03086 family metal-binding protein [Pseudonocardia sp. GCM10023141]|uniref:TIGR03086 family metal-binding protein n=1 Tax=Pseudonocardia sp. GCM10023141 TaxID=3252653 RepID=UPI00361DA783